MLLEEVHRQKKGRWSLDEILMGKIIGRFKLS